MYGNQLTPSKIDAFGQDGVQALAASVEQQLQKNGGNDDLPTQTVRILIPHHRTDFTVEWPLGQSLLDLSQQNEVLREYIVGTCGGTMACCTCHVYLDEMSFGLNGKPIEAEEDMLDLAYEPDEASSRLGCRLVMTREWMEQAAAAAAEATKEQPSDDGKRPNEITITIPAGIVDVYN